MIFTMCETSQLISEDLAEVLNNLILNLFLCKVRSRQQKAQYLNLYLG